MPTYSYTGDSIPDIVTAVVAGTGITVSNAAGAVTVSATGGGGGGGTVTSVSALSFGTTGTDVSSTVATGTTTPVITLNIPTASAANRGALSAADWTTFNSKGSGTVTSVAGLTIGTTGTDVGSSVATGTTTPVITLNIPTASAANRGALSAADWTAFDAKQAGNANLTAIAAMGTPTVSGFLKKFSDNTWALDTTSYYSNSYYIQHTGASGGNFGGVANSRSKSVDLYTFWDADITSGAYTKTAVSITSSGAWTATGAVARALYATATGATTNYAAIFDQGNVGIGTTSPGSKLDVKGTLRLSGSTSGYVGFSVPANAGSTTYLLPAADGTNGQVLSTNSTGTLSWVTASGGGGGASLSTANTWTENQNFDKSSVFSSIYLTTITTYGSTGWNPNYGSSPIYTTSANAGSGSSWTGTLTASGGATITFLVGDIITATHTATSGAAVTTVTLTVAAAVTAGASVTFTSTASVAAGTLTFSTIVVKRLVYQIRGKISATVATGDYGAVLNGLSLSAAEYDGTFSSDYGTSATFAKGGLFILGFNEGTSMTGSSVGAGTIRATNTTGTNNDGGNLTISGGNGTGTGASGQLIFKTGKAVASGTSNHTPTYRMIIDSGGNVGIGDYSNGGYNTRGMPGATLEIFGQMRIKGATAGYLGFAAADSSSSTTYTFPSADGTTGQVLSTNGTATLSWASTGSSITQVTFAESTAAPNDTIYVDSITAAGSTTNADITLSPKGTGALTAHVADSAVTGGNKRGANAVDWQRSRTAAAMVASGSGSTISGGKENTASGGNSTIAGGYSNTGSGYMSTVGGGYYNTASSTSGIVAGGYLNLASGYNSTVGGGTSNTASGENATVPGGHYGNAELEGKFAHASGRFSANGDAQFGRMILRGTTYTSGTATILTVGGGGTASATNTVVLGNNKVYYVTGQVVANAAVAGSNASTAWGTNHAVYLLNCIVKRVADAASTTISYSSASPSATFISTALSTPGTMSVTMSANTTLGGLQLSVAGITNTNIHWVAVVTTTEVG